MKLRSKVALITGSSNHIGKAAALRFAQEGAKVVVHSRSNSSGGKSTVEEIVSCGGDAIYLQADLRDDVQVEKLFAGVIDRYGQLNILVNNAGVAKAMPFLESKTSDWTEAFEHNLFSAVNCSRRAIPLMLNQGQGHIINTTSVRGIEHLGRPATMAYSAAKAALINFTKTLAKDVAPSIFVNAVAPGFVITSNYDSMPNELKEEFINSTSIKRWLQPEELTDVYLLLATSRAITGEVIVVDGGYTLK